MSALFNLYKTYFKTRLERCKNNPLYEKTYQAEKNLLEAIESSKNLEEFREKEKQERLLLKVSVAQVIDRENALAEVYIKTGKTLRALKSNEIFEKISSIPVRTETDLKELVTHVGQRHEDRIISDEFQSEFTNHIDMLEELEIFKNAEVTDEFKDAMVADSLKLSSELKLTINSYKRKCEDVIGTWRFNYDSLLNEEHHRRKIPFSDEIINKRIEQHRTIV
ncbi:MAG: hypothetical protein MI922_12230 [Bacteroidales bacterium]|nr:hypothetical protein [Bacteroidales bacterium]